MSSRRSRSGGTSISTTCRRWYKIARGSVQPRRPRRRSRLVAADDANVDVHRRGAAHPLEFPRPAARAAACSAAPARSSPISSRNTVPPSAISSLPFFWATAPVKAPRSWPNSSLSSSVSASAAQLMATNGRFARGLFEVDGACDQFLAGAGLAGDQHRRVSPRHLGNHLMNPLHGGAAPDQIAIHLEVRLQARAFTGAATRPVARYRARPRPGWLRLLQTADDPDRTRPRGPSGRTRRAGGHGRRPARRESSSR